MTETVQRLDELHPEQPRLIVAIKHLITNPPPTFMRVGDISMRGRFCCAVVSAKQIPAHAKPAYGLELRDRGSGTRAKVRLIGDPLPDGRQTQYEYIMDRSGKVTRFRYAFPECDKVRSVIERSLGGITTEGNEWFIEELTTTMRGAADALVDRMQPRLLDRGLELQPYEIGDVTKEIWKLAQEGAE